VAAGVADADGFGSGAAASTGSSPPLSRTNATAPAAATATTPPPTGLPTSTATQTPIPTGTAPVVSVPHGTQLLAIKEIAKDSDGKPTSVTILVDGKEYAGLTPQRDVDPAKWETFGTYFTLLNLTDTTATIRYGDGQIYDVTVGFYTIVTS
jgi:hypothetical protein